MESGPPVQEGPRHPRHEELLARLRDGLQEHYELHARIESGALATSYRATDRRHQRQVAIKVLHPELGAAVSGQRFLREIGTIASLHHPNLVTLLDSGETNDLLYYVTPYSEAESLRQKLDRLHQLGIEETLDLAIELADALDHAHRRGIVHRGIEPGSILLLDGHAVIADFGIARAIESASGDRITAIGVAVGNPLYASPEQSAGAEMVDGRADIYSLGCVVYELLVGEPPLAGSSGESTLARRLSEPPPSMRSRRSLIPPILDDVVSRALQRLPADRFETAAELRSALKTARRATPTLAFAEHRSDATITRSGRRLAAVLALDTAAYARLIEIDEAGTLERLRHLRRSVIDPGVTAHNGRIVKGTGDGILAEFASAVDAVRCAELIQRSMADSEAGEGSIQFRIGISLGDVVFEGGDIFGDGVNIASRLEGRAVPGGIVVSGSVHAQVRDKVDLSFRDLGPQKLKNISRPVPAFAVVVDESGPDVAARVVRRLLGVPMELLRRLVRRGRSPKPPSQRTEKGPVEESRGLP